MWISSPAGDSYTADLDQDLTWLDVLGVSMLAGNGFTASVLTSDLDFGADSAAEDHVKVAILVGSLIAAVLAGVLLKSRDRTYERMNAAEHLDADADEIPDPYERSAGPASPTIFALIGRWFVPQAIPLPPSCCRQGV